MKKDGGVTLKDIAEKCGISYSAVSKALKGSAEIGKETIHLVNETAQRMGYHPNAAARMLRTKRSFDIGVIFEDSTGSGLQHQYFATIFDGLNVAANAAGYNITFLNSENKNKRNYYAQAKYRGCDGVAVVSADFSRSDIRELLSSGIPVCTLDYISGISTAGSVMSDNFTGMTLLVESVIAKGHNRIAFIHGELSAVTGIRIAALQAAMKSKGIPADSCTLIEGKYHDPELSAAGTRALLNLKERPTCILYPDDFACLGGIRVLQDLHVLPGTDISIAGYDGIMLASLLSPPLTTYAQNGWELGRQLALQLIARIEESSEQIVPVVAVSGKLVPGKSVTSLL
jgi:LacI family transcriptional regulator